MVAIGAYTWTSFTVGTVSNVLEGQQLNNNFSYVSAMINKGITGANIAAGGIDAGALIAASIITHGHLSFAANGGVKCLQIGKSTVVSASGQLALKGVVTAAVNTTVTNTDVSVYFSNGDCWAAGDSYLVAPHVYITCVYATPTTAPTFTVKSVATNGAVVNVANAYATDAHIDTAITFKWMAIGDKV